MPVGDASVATEAGQLAARRAHVSRQLDLVLDESTPMAEMRRLIADLDRISADLATVLGKGDAPMPGSRG